MGLVLIILATAAIAACGSSGSTIAHNSSLTRAVFRVVDPVWYAIGMRAYSPDLRERIAHLEQTVAELKLRIEELTKELTEFRRQFQ